YSIGLYAELGSARDSQALGEGVDECEKYLIAEKGFRGGVMDLSRLGQDVVAALTPLGHLSQTKIDTGSVEVFGVEGEDAVQCFLQREHLCGKQELRAAGGRAIPHCHVKDVECLVDGSPDTVFQRRVGRKSGWEFVLGHACGVINHVAREDYHVANVEEFQ